MDDQISAGMKRLNALLGWWGMGSAPDMDAIARQFNRLQNFVSDVQKIYLDAASHHTDAVLDSNDRLARSAQGLLKGRKQADLLAAQAEIVDIVLEAASLHARTWAELQHEVQESYRALLVRSADEVSDQRKSVATPPAKDSKPSTARASEHLVNAG